MSPVPTVIAVVIAFLVGCVVGYQVIKRNWLAWQAVKTTSGLLRKHFGPASLESLAVSERQFPSHVRPDLQANLDAWANETAIEHFSGVGREYAFMGTSFSDLLSDDGHSPAKIVPARREPVDVGDELPIPCLESGLWTFRSNGFKGALFVVHEVKMGCSPTMRFSVATENIPAAIDWTEQFFHRLENAVAEAGAYRGKVLSFESGESYTGVSIGLKVHRLRNVKREEVILPARTLTLLERNVLKFAERRKQLSDVGLSAKKGLLFHGPPGTGKTHTIHYLAEALRDHTTLVITAEQVAHLSDYMTLARLLQPSLVVLEDADLIARNRDDADNPCAEVLLNKLLNEMDGLGEDAAIMFILTTNRPDALEPALAARPGRIDQAIEFPLPDEEGRRKLIRLYAANVDVTEEDIAKLAVRTDGVSAAFIKELMRRSMQNHLERDGTPKLAWVDIQEAVDEMLVHSGSINLRLLGAVPSE